MFLSSFVKVCAIGILNLWYSIPSVDFSFSYSVMSFLIMFDSQGFWSFISSEKCLAIIPLIICLIFFVLLTIFYWETSMHHILTFYLFCLNPCFIIPSISLTYLVGNPSALSSCSSSFHLCLICCLTHTHTLYVLEQHFLISTTMWLFRIFFSWLGFIFLQS